MKLARYTVTVASEVDTDYVQAASWWSANREKAPDALAEEVESAIRRLEQYGPRLGKSVERRGGRVWRRMELSRVRYYLYFKVYEETRTVEVLALWHMSRGLQPPR